MRGAFDDAVASAGDSGAIADAAANDACVHLYCRDWHLGGHLAVSSTVLFGGRASGLKVGARGGSVRVTKNNVWVTLAPYFFPLYTFVVALLWVLTAWWFPAIQPYVPIFLFWIGLTWSFHITFTMRFLAYNQPDIREHGRLFSYTLIYALNLLSLTAALTAVSSWTYAEAGGNLIDNLYLLGNAAHTFYEWALTRLPNFTG